MDTHFWGSVGDNSAGDKRAKESTVSAQVLDEPYRIIKNERADCVCVRAVLCRLIPSPYTVMSEECWL